MTTDGIVRHTQSAALTKGARLIAAGRQLPIAADIRHYVPGAVTDRSRHINPLHTAIKHDRDVPAVQGSIAQGGGSLRASLSPPQQHDVIALLRGSPYLPPCSRPGSKMAAASGSCREGGGFTEPAQSRHCEACSTVLSKNFYHYHEVQYVTRKQCQNHWRNLRKENEFIKLGSLLLRINYIYYVSFSYCTEKPTFAKPSMLANHIILMHGIKNPELTQMPSSKSTNTPAERGAQEQTAGTKKAIKKELEDSDAQDGPDAKKLRAAYKCAKCSFTADSSKEFLEHIPQHKSDNSTCQCVHCGLCYTSQISLNRHLFIVHKVKEEEDEEQQANPDAEKPFPSAKLEQSWECAHCDLTFDLQSAHAAHIRTHKPNPDNRQKTGSPKA
ncbi:unnamed protein product [Ranitomeya imitator]|uniref:C2H2-type domain-containing protein n=1 Tax=Ranitomeya imitator TaxID=111125 RepID=A0ABN9LZ73_9NEOB|nr:unnamed protein product [Ranitomeya imitator]